MACVRARNPNHWTTREFPMSFLFFVLVFFGRPACGILVTDQGSNPCPMHWKLGVLATGLPGKSLPMSYYIKEYYATFKMLLWKNIY